MITFLAGVGLTALLVLVFTPRKAKGIPEPKEHGPWGELNRCLGCDSAYPLGALLRYGDPGYKPTVQGSTRWVCPKCGACTADVVCRWIGREKPDGSYEWKHWSELPPDIKPKVDPLEELAALGKK